MSKSKGNKAARSANKVAELTAKAEKSKANAETTAQPGVISTIMSVLTNAKKHSKPVTSQDILDHLQKQFPKRTAAGMMITVRAQLSRLPKEKKFAITKKRDGRTVTYIAA